MVLKASAYTHRIRFCVDTQDGEECRQKHSIFFPAPKKMSFTLFQKQVLARVAGVSLEVVDDILNEYFYCVEVEDYDEWSIIEAP